MISKGKHQKHASLNKPDLGEFGRNELAFLGAPCDTIQNLARDLIYYLGPAYNVGYVDADHTAIKSMRGNEDGDGEFPGRIQMSDKQLFTRIDSYHKLSVYEKRAYFNKEDLVLVNGNHFKAKAQILIIDPKKSLEKKLDRLTDVKLILLKDETVSIPDFLKDDLPDWQQIPVFHLEEKLCIFQWVGEWMNRNLCPIKGLILTGGESKRMRKDKGGLTYHGTTQREHLLSLAHPYCSETYLSCNARQAQLLQGKFPLIEDTFLNLGPMGGILSALRSDPNAAWLTIACDLPYLTEKTLQYLIAYRNSSKVATAFLDPKGEFPEPLITIWEPNSYFILLKYLSQGISCPRKVLINSDVEILQAPDIREFYNVNHPEEYEEVMKELNMGKEG